LNPHATFQQQGEAVPEPEGHDEVDVDAVLDGYDGWLTRQPLAARTRDAYLAQVRDFVTWLASSEHGARALSDPDVRDWTVRDYKRYVKTTRAIITIQEPIRRAAVTIAICTSVLICSAASAFGVVSGGERGDGVGAGSRVLL